MHKYIFNARDIAAYIKYFSVPQYLEVSYMQYIFNLGPTVLAVPLTRDFESFKKWYLAFAAKRELLGATNHLLYICRKK